MKKRTREKIALVVFALLIVFGGLILASYFATGLSWTVAATFVDDTVGRMDGYTAIVYSGVIEPEKASADGLQEASSQGSDKDGATSSMGSEGPTAADSMGLRIMSYYPRLNPGGFGGVFPSEVRELYERKSAKTVTIDISNPKSYESPTVLYAGGKKIGIYSTMSYLTKSRLQKYMDYFKDEGADVVVCIAPRQSMLSTLDGTDVVILTMPSEDASPNGTRVGDTLVVESPKVEEVGVVNFSTNNIASARVIDAL